MLPAPGVTAIQRIGQRVDVNDVVAAVRFQERKDTRCERHSAHSLLPSDRHERGRIRAQTHD